MAATYLYVTPGAISGRKFDDANANGVEDAGEVGLTGWTITLTGTADQITDPANPSHIVFAGGPITPIVTTTGAGGAYSFAGPETVNLNGGGTFVSTNGLMPGTYTITETSQADWLQTFSATSTYTITLGANGIATVGNNTGNDFGNTPVNPVAEISITPNAVNEVGNPHTFTAVVQESDGVPGTLFGDHVDGFANVPNGTPVTITLSGSLGAVPDVNGASPPPAANPSFVVGTTTGGSFSTTFTSATAGLVTGTASALVTIAGNTLAVTTNGISPNSGPALKNFVDANIQITPPNPVNEVGNAETFTITVNALPGGTGTPTFALPVVTFPGGAPGTVGPVTLQSINGNLATYTMTINNSTSGTFTVQASDVITMGGVAVTRTTGDNLHNDGNNATKNYVDADIQINPPSATNPIGSPHTLTVSVEENDSNGAWFAAPNNTVVHLSLINSNGATATFVANGQSTLDVTITNGLGTVTADINSQTAGDVTINAGTVLLVNGVSLTRATGDDKGETGHFDSGPSIKHYGGTPGITIVKTADKAVVAPGGTVTYTYTVTNIGSLPFAAETVKIVDDNGTPANPADDFTITDPNSLAAGAQWIVSHTVTIPAPTASSTTSSIVSNFNGTPIAPGNIIWFNAVLKPGTLPAGTTTLSFLGSSIVLGSGSTAITMPVPDAYVNFSPSVTTPTTVFNTSLNA